MPKMKTHSGAKKRFKVTGSGKVKSKQSGKQHLARPKSRKQKLRLKGMKVLQSCDAKRVKKLLCK